MEGKVDDDSDGSDFRPAGETNAKQADERVAKIKKARGRVDARTPAAANQSSGYASDDNWESNFDQTATLQLERQMTLQPGQPPKMPAATKRKRPKPTNQQQASTPPPHLAR